MATHLQESQDEMNKIFDMLHSGDKEMRRLGMKLVEGWVKSYAHFKYLRGLSVKGKAFFPEEVKFQAKFLGMYLKKKYSNLRIKEEKLKGAIAKDARETSFEWAWSNTI